MSRGVRIFIVAATAVACVLAFLLVIYVFPKDRPLVTNFEECARAGYRVLNTVPRQCEIARGLSIVEQTKPITCIPHTFEEFTKKDPLFSGAPANVDFSTYDVPAENKQALIDGAKLGPNFSGRYTVVKDGCGTGCHVILDAKTGRIIVYGVNSSYGIEFRRDSSLMIINPKAQIPSTLTAEERKGLATEYWRFENSSMFNLCPNPLPN